MNKEREALRAKRKGKSILVAEGLGEYYWRPHDLPPLTFPCSRWLKLCWWGSLLLLPGEKINGKMQKRDKGGVSRGSALGNVDCQIANRALGEPADVAWLVDGVGSSISSTRLPVAIKTFSPNIKWRPRASRVSMLFRSE